MTSLGFSPPPLMRLIASSSSARSYVRSIEIEDVPVLTMPHMSPSWIRFFSIFRKISRMRGVCWKSMCRSSTNSRNTRPAASLVGRATGRMMPSCTGAGGGASVLYARPP